MFENNTHSDKEFNPKISIIIPAYNVSNYIAECLESVINQKYKNLEIIVVDDGSTDDTPKIIDKYAYLDDRIIAIHKKNEGVSCARNAGLDIITGEYVSFIDGDDFIDNNLYSTIIPIFKDYPDTDFVQFGYHNYYEQEDKQNYKTSNDILDLNFVDGEKPLYDYVNAKTFQGVIWNKLYKKDLLKTIRFAKGKDSEDGAFILEVMFFAKRTIVIDNPLYYYRKRLGSATNKLSDYVFDEWDILEDLKARYSNDENFINCIKNYSVEHSMYLLIDILKRGGENKKEMLKKTINYAKTLRDTKIISPFGIKYIRYKIYLFAPRLFCIISQFMRKIKKKS